VPRFLVQITVGLPADMPRSEREALLEREAQRGRELRREGVIEDIWRIPGRLANVGIWRADTATALHQAISSLPVWPWTEITVTALADHHLTRHPEVVEDASP
jgi:muconolactone D-isomerase